MAAITVIAGCKKKVEERPDQTIVNEQRQTITYDMTIVPRAVNTTGDTLWVKLNGNVVLDVKGNITPTYYSSGMMVGTKTVPRVKTGDIVEIYYHPGVVTFGNGTKAYDENGLALYLDHSTANNILLKEFACRCIGSFSTRIP